MGNGMQIQVYTRCKYKKATEIKANTKRYCSWLDWSKCPVVKHGLHAPARRTRTGIIPFTLIALRKRHKVTNVQEVLQGWRSLIYEH